jgi:regulator of sirC expression with transglutaminase-like and TPR domain
MSITVLDRAERVAAFAAADQPGRAALELAGFVYPEVDMCGVERRIDAMAARVEGGTHLALRRVVGIEEGIGGNVDDYYDPDNSFLNCVLEARRGIPISLSILWIEVGRRAGMEVEGVGLPGHFLVYAAGQLVDPFHYGEAIGFDEAAGLVAAALGGAPRLDRHWLEPATTPDIIRRMLRNLEGIYVERGDADALEWVLACQAVMALVE